MVDKLFEKLSEEYTLKAYSQDYNAWKEETKTPGFYPVRKSFKQTKAKDLENAILSFCDQMREQFEIPVTCVKIGSSGKYNSSMDKFLTEASTKGISDLWVTFNGRSVCVEVKIGKDRMSKVQEKFALKQQAAKGYYFVVKTWNDWIDVFRYLLNRYYE